MTTDIRPVVGSDVNTWGQKLLDWLGDVVNPDGTLSDDAVLALLQSVVTPDSLAFLDFRYAVPTATFKSKGAKGDCQQTASGNGGGGGGSITAGLHIVACAAGTFAQADVGKSIAVASAGGITPTTQTLRSVITAVSVDGSQATIQDAAANSVTNATVTWGTNDTAAIRAATAALPRATAGAFRQGNAPKQAGWVYGNEGMFYVDDSLDITPSVGARLEGASRGGCAIVQTKDNTPIYRIYGDAVDRVWGWTIKGFTLHYATHQPRTNTMATCIYLDSQSGTKIGTYNWLVEDINFDFCATCIGSSDDTVPGNSNDTWGGKVRYCRSGSNVTRSFFNVTAAAGQPNMGFDHLYILGDRMCGPTFMLNGGFRSCRMDNIEINNTHLGAQLIRVVGGGDLSIGNFRLEEGTYAPYGTMATRQNLGARDQSNGKTVTDGVTNGTTTFTSASASFGPWMVGWKIKVVGGLTGGGDLTTTIAGYISPTQVVLAAAATLNPGAGLTAYFGNDCTGDMFMIPDATFSFDLLEIEGICHTGTEKLVWASIFNYAPSGNSFHNYVSYVKRLQTAEWFSLDGGHFPLTNTNGVGAKGFLEIGTFTGSFGSGLPVPGTISGTNNYANGDTVTVGWTIYKFVTGAPGATSTRADGFTLTDVKIGANVAATLSNLAAAINNSGSVGNTLYGGGTNANPLCSSTTYPASAGAAPQTQVPYTIQSRLGGGSLIHLSAADNTATLPLRASGANILLGGFRLGDNGAGTAGVDTVQVLHWVRGRVTADVGANHGIVLPGGSQDNIISFESPIGADKYWTLPDPNGQADLFNGYYVEFVRNGDLATGAGNIVIQQNDSQTTPTLLESIAAPGAGKIAKTRFTYRRKAGISGWVQTANSVG